MTALRVAVATSSELAAAAAGEIAALGGNAVDCAIAAALVTMNTEPGVCALAGGAYITIARPGVTPVTIDGGIAVPGMSLDRSTNQGERVRMEYGGGVETIVGAASVGVPGTVAALDSAWRAFGQADWATLWQPAIMAADAGFPLPQACHYYLNYSGHSIFSRSADGEKALFDADGKLRAAGATVRVPHLAETLEEIATVGADTFYVGRIGQAMADHVADGGGALTPDDLASYRAVQRPALTFDLRGWQISCNPPPAIGGAVLASLIALAAREVDGQSRSAAGVAAKFAAAQRATLNYRRQRLDWSDDVAGDVAELRELSESGQLLHHSMSSATVHTSAVDDQGLACAITSSAGYGAGDMPAGTGLWLNNCMGELELNRRGLDAGPPGARLPSNMCPGVAADGDSVIAFGSPGADRITTALQQVLLRHLLLGEDLTTAIASPRLHYEVEHDRFAVERGLDTASLAPAIEEYPPNSMYFGGVGAARFDSTGLSAAADPRRAGGVFLSGMA